jgi:Tfp pilus assembly protein PilZ
VTQAERSLLVVGSFREETTRRISDAAGSVGATAVFVDACEAAPIALADAEPLAILIRMDAPGAQAACAQARAHARLSHVPILGVPRERDDLAFTEMFSWGGDDVIGVTSPHPLARRLRPLIARSTAPAESKAARQGQAIVAGADATWRSVMGRALYNGGFAVRFVTNAEDLVEESLAEGVKLVVATDELPGTGASAAVGAARARGSQAAWIIAASPKRMQIVQGDVAPLARVCVADGFAPPENVLFLANELLGRRDADKRASPRLLYGTTVGFRVAGREHDDVGFSYNISAGGVYVRTLASIQAGQEVWLEMWPPRSERRVRLAGSVAWRRPFGPSERATVPTGFGVRITDGLAGDLDRWRAGYEAFAEHLLGARQLPADVQ